MLPAEGIDTNLLVRACVCVCAYDKVDYLHPPQIAAAKQRGKGRVAEFVPSGEVAWCFLVGGAEALGDV